MDLDPFIETFIAAAVRGIGILVRRLRGERDERTVRVALPADVGPVTVVVVVFVPASPPVLEVEADDKDAT